MADVQARSRVGLLSGLVLAALLLLPLLGPGHVLVRDMAFVPRTPLTGRLLGLEGVPRAVPSDLVVAVAGRVVPTGWLQDLVLLAVVVGGAWGAARLAPVSSRAAAAVAAVAYGWSPYLHERLLLGQWALLVGWAVLPWGVRAALDWRRGATGWWAVAALSVAALGGANALLLVAVAVVVCGRPLPALAATTVLALPWAVPALLQDPVAGDPAGVTAFAARGDTPLGVVGSLLTGGGVWAREAVPPGRSAGTAVAVVLLLAALAGLPTLLRRYGGRPATTAVLGLALALLGTVPLTRDLLQDAVVDVPAAGLLRDGQRWVALVVLVLSAALACTAESVLLRVAEVPARRLLAAVLVAAPVAALPGAAWAEGGRLESSTYPAAWRDVTARADGTVLVLPWTLYRAFPWSGSQPVLDPATKALAHPVVDDALPLGGSVVRGEDPVARALDPAVTAGGPLLAALRAQGVDQVLVERTTAGADAAQLARQVEGLTAVVVTDELALYAVPGAQGRVHRVSAWPVVVGDVAAAGLASTALVLALRRRRTCLPL